jgi:Family of unknown function (DUF5636)
MTAKHSFADVKADLEKMLGAERVQQVGATRVDDYARIASLLTDEDACRVYLARLNSELIGRCRAVNMIKKTLGVERKSLKTTSYQHPAKPDESTEVVKHNKVFTGFFKEWEDAAGFNQGVQQIEGGKPGSPETVNLPGRAATLTEFVEPNDFRKYLLKHGYHWKDAGVGGRHGEFTHRIHWYIIVEYARANPNWLTHTPIDLFKTCGEPSTVVKSGWTVWDYIVDCGDDILVPNGGKLYGQGSVYRSPDKLHKFLCDAATRSSKDLWCLAYLIWGRRQKREHVGSQQTTQDLQNYIEAHNTEKEFRVVGFKTGEGVTTHGTIMWQTRQ